MSAEKCIDSSMILSVVHVTEMAAIAASQLVGRGDEKAADAAAVKAMRDAFNAIDFDGTVVIGEGERDQAPMLYIGENVGTGRGPKIDIALDPLEGTTITAKGKVRSQEKCFTGKAKSALDGWEAASAKSPRPGSARGIQTLA